MLPRLLFHLGLVVPERVSPPTPPLAARAQGPGPNPPTHLCLLHLFMYTHADICIYIYILCLEPHIHHTHTRIHTPLMYWCLRCRGRLKQRSLQLLCFRSRGYLLVAVVVFFALLQVVHYECILR